MVNFLLNFQFLNLFFKYRTIHVDLPVVVIEVLKYENVLNFTPVLRDVFENKNCATLHNLRAILLL